MHVKLGDWLIREPNQSPFVAKDRRPWQVLRQQDLRRVTIQARYHPLRSIYFSGVCGD
jgi:hypothetical protein